MANITIKELLAADQVADMVDKINFNFDQLLLNGGGPKGIRGIQGDFGPVGPRGTLWFTAVDLYTTENSPSWNGTTQRINDISSSGYPQFGGDPNRYLPVGNGNNPENTLTFGNVNKLLRDGDLYIQEGDDILDGFESTDGDIWEYDGVTEVWVYTGVNIKGEKGLSGNSGLQQWVREINPNSSTDDLLYPKIDTGQETPRILIGSPANMFDNAHVTAQATFFGQGQGSIAFGHEDLHSSPDNDKMATITPTSTGSLIIQGSQIASQGNTPQINILANDAEIVLQSNGSTFVTYAQKPDTVGTPQHEFVGGQFNVISPDQYAEHSFSNISGNALNIKLNTSNYHHISTDNLHLVLQELNSLNVGIGQFGTTTPVNKLSVAGNSSIGNAYKNIPAPGNGIIIEGSTGIGYSAPTNKLSINGGLSVNTNRQTTNSTVAIFEGGNNFPNSKGVQIQLRSNNNQINNERNLVTFYSKSGTQWGLMGKWSQHMAIGSHPDLEGIIFSTNNNNVVNGAKMFINNDGKIGIGTGLNAPQDKVHIDAGLFDYAIRIQASSYFAREYSIGHIIGNPTNNPGRGSFTIYDQFAGEHRIVVSGGADGIPTGNVGIGTEEPFKKLTVEDKDNTDVEVLRLSSQGGSGSTKGETYLGMHFFLGSNGNANYAPARIGVEQDGETGFRGNIAFQTRSVNTDSEPDTKMRVMHNDRVVIGSSKPYAKFQVDNPLVKNVSDLETFSGALVSDNFEFYREGSRAYLAGKLKIKDQNSYTMNSVIFTLPVGYRPAGNQIKKFRIVINVKTGVIGGSLSNIDNTNFYMGWIYINPNGECRLAYIEGVDVPGTGTRYGATQLFRDINGTNFDLFSQQGNSYLQFDGIDFRVNHAVNDQGTVIGSGAGIILN